MFAPMKYRPSAKAMAAAATTSPTRRGVQKECTRAILCPSEPRSEEMLGVRLLRVPQLVRRTDLDDAAIVQHRDHVADVEGAADVVADHHARHAQLLARSDDHVVDAFGGEGIEAGGRLVVERS